MRVEERFIIVPIDTEVNEDIFVYYTAFDKTKKIVKYWVTIVDEPYAREYIDAVTGEPKQTVLEPGIYGRPNLYTEGTTEYTEVEVQQIMSTPGWKPDMDSYTP